MCNSNPTQTRASTATKVFRAGLAAGFAVLLVVPALPAQESDVAMGLADLTGSLIQDSWAGADSREPPRITLAEDGFVRFFGAPLRSFAPPPESAESDPDQIAYSFLRAYSNLFGATSGEVDFSLVRSRTRDGRTHVRFQQTYAGIPVFGAQVIVQLNRFGGIECVVSDIARETSADLLKGLRIAPAIEASEAVAIARDLLILKSVTAPIESTTPTLRFFAPSVLDEPGSVRLVWDFKVSAEPGSPMNRQLLLDAHSGEIVRSYPLHHWDPNRQISDAGGTAADPGTPARFEGGGVVLGNPDVNDAYDFFGDAYHFFLAHHGRVSWDDQELVAGGAAIDATVRHCESVHPQHGCTYQNAFWDPDPEKRRFYFTEGMAADDIVGHEYTHAVTMMEVDPEDEGLVYANQSGAISESLSDVWGEFIDLGNLAGTDDPIWMDVWRWQLGEDSIKGVVRHMKRPGTFGDPDRLGSGCYVPLEDCIWDPDPAVNTCINDGGGVHTNSGVNNKLAYLLTDGEAFNGQTVYGMDIPKVADLYYAALPLLPKAASYNDLSHALQQAALNLVHDLFPDPMYPRWTAEDVDNVERACTAVEITDTELTPALALHLRTVYVDWAYNGGENWGSWCNPFNLVAEGIAVMPQGGRLIIESGSYDENVVFNVPGTVEASGGTVTIGN